ncbi:hypothetical protein WJX72_004705 [[Myrmecia] bisecta]|uniref:Propionyl-CoA carboxylase alpha chain, mitochondrial n=1 Tax=[Myrmecia] bisecta TaxID=41462 RepID=A0AAW1PHE9_9CHLO
MRRSRQPGLRLLEADKRALHARFADEAVCIGPAAAAQSYLRTEAILEAVRKTGAQAVHPGYGFLSENAMFAKALEANGTVFIGPPVGAIEAMGDKVESKILAKSAGVNTIPGWAGVVADEQQALKLAQEIGFPVMIKASAGGGGKGMRIAWNEEEVLENFQISSQEAVSSFGDGRMLLEKYIEEPRHIEIQVLGDQHGNTVYLPERECSIQRRNQKVIEEAPSTFLDAATRQAMGEQAVALCKAVGYYSAGTLEFLVDKHRQFYFLEMNTRLQVEHPVTEYITQLDLVEQMLNVAAGRKLPFTQDQVRQIHGWAMESRVYAEDPARGFLPSIGRLNRYVEPSGANVRVDSGIQEGSEISIHYDPLISKLVTHGSDRQSAIDTMCSALDRYVIRGVTHNIPLLRSVMAHPDFQAGNINTNFLPQHFPEKDSAAPLKLPLTPAQQQQLLALAAYFHTRRSAQLGAPAARAEQALVLTLDGVQHPVVVRHASQQMVGLEASTSGALEVQLADRLLQVVPPAATAAGGQEYVAQLVQAHVDGSLLDCQILERRPRGLLLQFCGAHREVLIDTPAAAALAQHMPTKTVADTSKVIASPMPGSLVSVAVAAGDTVAEGDEVAVVEAMKMRNVLRAERAGRIKSVEAQAGAVLAADQIIIHFE